MDSSLFFAVVNFGQTRNRLAAHDRSAAGGFDMVSNEKNDWRDLYRAALLELNPTQVPGRIAAAQEKIAARMVQEDQEGPRSEEGHALAKALKSLRVLERANESRPSKSPSYSR